MSYSLGGKFRALTLLGPDGGIRRQGFEGSDEEINAAFQELCENHAKATQKPATA